MGAVSWVVGGTLAMLFMGLALHQEMADFPGGPQALATSVMPAAEALRPMRWPAERLDTLGGYLTYHNITLLAGLLSLYAALQGARAIRRAEQRHSLEQVLATGWSRSAVVRDRALGFAISLAFITLGLAAGVAWAMAASDEPDASGSLITITAVGLCALVAYALGLLVSQLTATVRSAAGISAITVVVLYVASNVADEIGWLGVIRYVTPFHYANQSRALVPGHGLDPSAMLALVLMALTLIGLAALAFASRDYGTALWTRRRREPQGTAPVDVQHWWLRTTWLAHLAQHRLGLVAWTFMSAAFAGLLMALQPTVMEAWALFDFMAAIMGGPGNAVDVLYLSFAADVAAPVIVAYVITQAAAWIADRQDGRVEAILAAPVSPTRLVWERIVAALVGVLVITVGTLAATVVGAAAVGADVDAAGIARTALVCLLLGWAMAGLAALAVAGLNSAIAVTVLAGYVAAAYLLTWMIPIFGWPEWTRRLSIFDAFGHPYLDWPATGAIALLLLLAVGGSMAAAAVTERLPKVG